MKASTNLLVAQGAVFSLKFQIAFKLQDIAYQTEDLIEFRKQLVNDIVGKVTELNKKNLAIRQNIKYVDLYLNQENYMVLTYKDIVLVKDKLTALIFPQNDVINAICFDALMLDLELAYLFGKKIVRQSLTYIKR